MKRIVLIDGENLMYGLRKLLGKDKQKADRSILNNFDFRGLFNDILIDNLPTQILWFGAKLRIYDNSEDIKIKSESAVRFQSKFINQIQKQKIQFIKVGYLRARETEPCYFCKHNQWKLAEKGVDVGLAVRMITEANKETELVIVSADTDLLPAFKIASKMGSSLININYEYSPTIALSKESNQTRTISLAIAKRYIIKN